MNNKNLEKREIPEAEQEVQEISEEQQRVVENLEKLSEKEFKEKYGPIGEVLLRYIFDSVSGLLKREYFFDRLNKLTQEELGGEKKVLESEITHFSARLGGDEFDMFLRSKNGETVIISGDLAYLGLYNNNFGHLAGDSVIRAVGDSFKAVESKIEGNLNTQTIIETALNGLEKEIKNIDVNKLKHLEGQTAPKIHLDFAYAKISEAQEAYKKIKLVLTGKEKEHKIVDLLIDIADQRTKILKALWRVNYLCGLAEELTQKELTGLEQKTFDDEFKFSLKAIAGLNKEDVIEFVQKELSQVTDPKERRQKIKDMVIQRLDIESEERMEKAKEEVKVVYEIAKRGIKF